MQFSRFFRSAGTVILRARQVPPRTLLVATTAALILIGTIVYAVSTRPEEEPTTSRLPLVTTESVRLLSTGREPLPVLGKVQSQSEATVRTETQGIITRLNYELGDFVSAGAVIAEIENASERAGVRQAQATLDLLLRESVREEGDARLNALNTYRNAFTLADDAILNRADQFFNNPRSGAPQINIGFFSINSINERRARISDRLSVWQIGLSTLSPSDDLFSNLEQAEDDLRFIKSFLDDLASLVNRQKTSATLSQATLDAQKASIATARTNVDTAIGNIAVAKNDLESKIVGDRGDSERLAQIESTEAALNIARAALEKTIIRAPISGTINVLELERGDFIPASEPAVTVANNTSLEVVAFITEEDRRTISTGAKVAVENRYRGTVTSMAPTLDPATNKIKVTIEIADDTASLTNGDTVRAVIGRNPPEEDAELPQEIIIPLTALKVETDRIVVFTVSEDDTLVAHPVTEGPLAGNGIVILDGIDFDMEIVLDARGLNEGDLVEVASS